MSSQRHIKIQSERTASALRRRPATGHSTYRSTTRMTTGLQCVTTEGAWSLNCDMPESAGGNGGAPTPGVLGRAALGSCLAIGYMMWASRLEVPIKSLEVIVEADDDSGGLFGTTDVSPGYSSVRYLVRINSTATEREVLAVLDKSDKHDPWLDIFVRPIKCTRQVELVG